MMLGARAVARAALRRRPVVVVVAASSSSRLTIIDHAAPAAAAAAGAAAAAAACPRRCRVLHTSAVRCSVQQQHAAATAAATAAAPSRLLRKAAAPSASDAGFDYANVFAGSPLNRLANHRRDEHWLDARLHDPNARFVVLWKLLPIVTTTTTASGNSSTTSSSSSAATTNAMGTGPVTTAIRWFTRAELATLAATAGPAQDGWTRVAAAATTSFAAHSSSTVAATRVFLGVDERPGSPLHGGPLFAIDPNVSGGVTPLDPAAAAAAAAATNDGKAGGGGWRVTDVRSAVSTCTHDDVSILAQARSMCHWHATHAFCGGCGAPTVARDAGYMRQCTTAIKQQVNAALAAQTPACPSPQHFPRSDPVTIMLLHDPNNTRVLLHRQRHFAAGVYSAVAGFMEPGESIEEGVRRESLEEVGVRVGAVRYHSSQPWPFPHSLMIGCFGEVLATDPAVRDFAKPLQIDAHELESARWFTRAELRAMLHNSTLPPHVAARYASGTTAAPDGPGAASAYRVPAPLGIAHVLARVWLDTTTPSTTAS